MHTAEAMQLRQAPLQAPDIGPQTSTRPAKGRKGNGKGSQRTQHTLQQPGAEAGPSAASSDVQSQALMQVQPAIHRQRSACCATSAQLLQQPDSSTQHSPAEAC